MIEKGIILAGGNGTRMSPLTKAVNKQLLPIYDKPLIFYPLSIMMLAKIKNILIIVNKGQLDQYKKIIPNGDNLGINITYKEQDTPKGLPDAFVLGEKFIQKSNVALILGDNFFYGQNLSSSLINSAKLKKGAKILLYKVNNPELFGVSQTLIGNETNSEYHRDNLSKHPEKERFVKKVIQNSYTYHANFEETYKLKKYQRLDLGIKVDKEDIKKNGLVTELERLNRLYKSGSITKKEFEVAKQKLLK